MKSSRRDFICKTASGLTVSALASQTDFFGKVAALAQTADTKRSLSVPDDYRALVCIYLTGGNDGNNMVIPNHSDANVSNYAYYSAGRSAQGLALAQNSLLPITVPRIGGLTYGLHPSFGTVATNSGIHPLWAQGKLAIVPNMGTLVRPITRSQYLDGSVPRPRQLFSHTDQSNQHMNARADVVMLSGWGGRIADRVTLSANPSRLIPTISTIVGGRIFTVGESMQPLAVGPAPTPLSSILSYVGFNGSPASNARLAALTAEMNLIDGSDLVNRASEVHQESIRISQSLNNTADTTVTFPISEIGNQLKQIARLIKNRSALNMNRQIFFCAVDGFDTHTSQIPAQNGLFLQLSQAARAFYDEMTAQGISDKVTQFTLSDFGRTFAPNGITSNVGTDHAWANHSLIIGGSVLGGDFYGMNTSNGTPFPTLVTNGPDDVDSGSNAKGRWIPTTSVEQYAATLSRWFGVPQADMPYVFPNLGNFTSADLGFMQP